MPVAVRSHNRLTGPDAHRRIGDVVGELARQFLDDLDQSKEFDLSRWNRRPLLKRVTESATDLLRQSL